MQGLERRVQKLEDMHQCTDEEMIIVITCLGAKDGEPAEVESRQYPPLEEQIADGRATGKKVFMVYDF